MAPTDEAERGLLRARLLVAGRRRVRGGAARRRGRRVRRAEPDGVGAGPGRLALPRPDRGRASPPGSAAVANGVRHGARWPRTPTLVWQVLQVLVGVTGLPWKVGLVLAVLGVAVGYGVLRADVVPGGQTSSLSPSRSTLRLRVIRRDTCICETPTSAAICDCDKPRTKRSARIVRSRAGSRASSGRRVARCSTAPARSR